MYGVRLLGLVEAFLFGLRTAQAHNPRTNVSLLDNGENSKGTVEKFLLLNFLWSDTPLFSHIS